MKKLSRESFKEILFNRYFPLQFLQLIFLGGLYYQKTLGELDFYFNGLLIWIFSQVILTSFITGKIHQRLEDMLDKNSKGKTFLRHFLTAVLLPYLLIWEVHLLAKFDNLNIAQFRKKLFSGFVLVPFQMILTLTNFQPEYPEKFLGSQVGASSGYIATIVIESEKLFSINSEGNDYKSEELTDYLEKNDLTSTGLILSTAIFASDIYKKHQGNKERYSSDKAFAENSVKAAHELIEKTSLVFEKTKTLKSPITISNGLQLITPTSLVEIGLIELVDTRILMRARGAVQESLTKLHRQVEKKIAEDKNLNSKYSPRQRKLSRAFSSIIEHR
ncbi:MAG: hypothetical protein CME65_15590 [Halobacteriovoraceae bacterium]|nr:hypothetical protein [Halobacteriovoraceae bacterium]|tara:strand:+ start:4146 stop:5138 length:993 start_codon:yes stop_codon:yes gene_type:complete